jgi:hypothetical protein
MLVAINLDIDLESIFVTALEGGSNHWIDFSSSTFKHLKDKYSQMPFSERVYNEFISGGVIDVLDAEGDEDESDVIGQISLATAPSRLAKMIDDGFIWSHADISELLDGSADAIAADIVLQYLALGEIVYG